MSAILKLIGETRAAEIIHFEELNDVEFPMEQSLDEQIAFVQDVCPTHTLLVILLAEAEYNELVNTLNNADHALNDWNLGESEIHTEIKEILKKHDDNDE